MACHILFYKGNHNLVWYNAAPATLEDLRQFAESIRPYTGATIEKVSITLELEMYVDGTATDTVDDVNATARVLMRDTDTGEAYGLNIADPPNQMFELITGEGKRVKQVYGDDLAAKFGQLSGRNLQFEEGWLAADE